VKAFLYISAALWVAGWGFIVCLYFAPCKRRCESAMLISDSQHAHPRALLPWPTQMLIDYRLFLYAIPLPSLLIALWFSFRGGLDAPRTQIVGAFSFFLLVLLVCITLLTVMIPFLPWGIVLVSGR